MNKGSSKSSLFLMELIMSVLFFAIAAAVCVQLFIKSHSLSRSSVELNHAVIACESVAEEFYGLNGELKDAKTYYDEDFEPCEEALASYVLTNTVSTNTETGLLTEEISFDKIYSGETIYSITASYLKK